jgi:hypothetical protein
MKIGMAPEMNEGCEGHSIWVIWAAEIEIIYGANQPLLYNFFALAFAKAEC